MGMSQGTREEKATPTGTCYAVKFKFQIFQTSNSVRDMNASGWSVLKQNDSILALDIVFLASVSSRIAVCLAVYLPRSLVGIPFSSQFPADNSQDNAGHDQYTYALLKSSLFLRMRLVSLQIE